MKRLLLLALLLAGCNRTVTASGELCIQVRFDSGGHRTIATAKSVTKVSNTTVILHDPYQVGGRYYPGVDRFEVTSANISMMEGLCWPPQQ